MPEVDLYLELPRAVRAATRRLKDGHFQHAIVLPNSFRSALTSWLARIPRRTGYRRDLRGGLLNDARSRPPRSVGTLLEQFLGLLDEPAAARACLPRLAPDHDAAEGLARRLGIDPQRPLLALCPGAAFGPAKRWPSGHFGSVARHYSDRGWQVAWFGGRAETRMCAAVAALHGGLDLAGRTDLGEAAQLLSLAAAVVSNDSGLMHLAAAVGAPVTAVFGSSDAGFTPPLGDQARVVSNPVSCAPCFARYCRFGDYRCLSGVSPAQVLAALDTAA
jgi:heptosyltransferase-2